MKSKILVSKTWVTNLNIILKIILYFLLIIKTTLAINNFLIFNLVNIVTNFFSKFSFYLIFLVYVVILLIFPKKIKILVTFL